MSAKEKPGHYDHGGALVFKGKKAKPIILLRFSNPKHFTTAKNSGLLLK
jgi:hypothetical protein